MPTHPGNALRHSHTSNRIRSPCVRVRHPGLQAFQTADLNNFTRPSACKALMRPDMEAGFR